VNTLVIDPLTPSILYAGTDHGVFKSTNRGATWNVSSAGLPGELILTLVIEELQWRCELEPEELGTSDRYRGLLPVRHGSRSADFWYRVREHLR
jgi:hypothetical protein